MCPPSHLVIRADYSHCMPGCCWPSNWATAVATCRTLDSAVVLPGGRLCSTQCTRAHALILLHAQANRLLPGYRRIGMHGRVSESAAPPAQVSTHGGRGAEMGFRRLLRRAALALTMPQCQAARGHALSCCCNVFRGSRHCTRVNLARTLEKKQATR